MIQLMIHCSLLLLAQEFCLQDQGHGGVTKFGTPLTELLMGALSWVETPAAEGSRPSRVSPVSPNPQKFEHVEGTGVCVTKHSCEGAGAAGDWQRF